ncbi:hypothetical protein D9M68_709510 [compost metagenome]
MHHQVEAQLQGTLGPGAGEGVVGDGDDAALPTQAGDRLEVGQAQQGIARGFHPEHAGVVLDRRLDQGDVAEIDEAEAVSGAALAHLVEEPEGAAIKVIAGKDVGTAVEQLQHRGDGREPGREGKGLGAALQVRDATLQGPARRVVGASVVQPLVHAGAVLGVGGVGVDRRHDGPGGGVRNLAGVDDSRREGTPAIVVLLAHARVLRR